MLSRSQTLDISEERIGYGFPLDYTLLYNTTRQQFLEEILTGFPTQTEAEHIISTFFLYVSSNWYCLDETWFRDRLTHLYDWGLDTACIECDFLYLVLMVFALGSQFIQLRPPSMPLDQTSCSTRVTDPPGVLFLRSAVRLLPLVLSIPSLESCQGFLITALYLLPMSQSNASYTYVVLAMRVAMGLGLHHDHSRSSLPARKLEYRHRIFWTLYCVERRLGIALGYPENIQERDIACLLPQLRQDLDGDDLMQGRRLSAFAKLTLIISRLMRETGKASWSDYLHKSRTALHPWWTDLPDEVQSLHNDRLRANAHLHINYHQVWISASRDALIHLVRDRLQNNPSPADEKPRDPAIHHLARLCVKSATEMINLLNLLRAHNQLAYFSFTDFHSCVSATIILLLGSILYPCAAASDQVHAAMDTVRFMAEGNRNATGGLKLVESFLAIVTSSLSALHGRQSPGGAVGNGTGTDGAEQQDCSSYLEGNQSQIYTGQSECIDESGLDGIPATMSSRTDGAYMGQSPGGPDLSFYDDIWAVLTECSSDELRSLGISGLFDGDGSQGLEHGD